MVSREAAFESRWVGELIVVAYCYVTYFRAPFGEWLGRNLCAETPGARVRRSLYSWFVFLRIIPHPPTPWLNAEKLAAAGFPRGLKLRLATQADHDACIEIYRLNEVNRFPKEVAQEFDKLLRREPFRFIVVEQNDRVIACGGSVFEGDSHTLIYGLVHPSFQSIGIGRLLLAARLVRPKMERPMIVMIHAVKESVGYFKRWGFAEYSYWLSNDGKPHPSAAAALLPENQMLLKTALRECGYDSLDAKPLPENG